MLHNAIKSSLPITARMLASDLNLQAHFGAPGFACYVDEQGVRHLLIPDLPLEGDLAKNLGLGGIIHEDGHLQDTNLSLLQSLPPGFIHGLANILEDIRIEDVQMRRYAGARGILSRMINAMVATNAFEVLPDDVPVPALVMGFCLHCLRAKVLRQEAMNAISDHTEDLFRRLIPTQIGNAVEAEALKVVTSKTTEEVVDIVYNIIAILKQEQPEEDKDDESSESSPDSSSSDGTDDKEGNGDADGSDKADPSPEGNADSQSGSEEDSQDSSSSDGTEGGEGNADEADPSQEGNPDSQSAADEEQSSKGDDSTEPSQNSESSDGTEGEEGAGNADGSDKADPSQEGSADSQSGTEEGQQSSEGNGPPDNSQDSNSSDGTEEGEGKGDAAEADQGQGDQSQPEGDGDDGSGQGGQSNSAEATGSESGEGSAGANSQSSSGGSNPEDAQSNVDSQSGDSATGQADEGSQSSQSGGNLDSDRGEDNGQGSMSGGEPDGTESQSVADTVKEFEHGLDDAGAGLKSCDIGQMLTQKLGEMIQKSEHRAVRLPDAVKLELVGGEGENVIERLKEETNAVRRKTLSLLEAQARSKIMNSRTGSRLDPKRLWKMRTGNCTVFEKRIEGTKQDTAIQLLVDVSSSMANSNRVRVAMDAALSVALAMESAQGIETSVAAFPHCHDGIYNDVLMVADFGEPVRKTASRFPAVRANGSTPMAEALLWAGYNLTAQRQSRQIIVPITDGEPDDKEAAMDVLRSLEAAGIEVIGIGINFDVSHMFHTSGVIQSIEDLPATLFGLLRNALAKAA